MWACEWLDNICALVRRMKVVSHQNTSCWVFSPNTFKPVKYTHQTCLNWEQANSRQTGENPPYKGGWWKIGYHQEGRDESEFSKPGLALNWSHPCSLPIKWGSVGCPLNINLRPRVVLDTQVWLLARDRDGRSYP